MGRPKKLARERQSHLIALRLTPAEHKKLEQGAWQSGLSLSQFIRIRLGLRGEQWKSVSMRASRRKTRGRTPKTSSYSFGSSPRNRVGRSSLSSLTARLAARTTVLSSRPCSRLPVSASLTYCCFGRWTGCRARGCWKLSSTWTGSRRMVWDSGASPSSTSIAVEFSRTPSSAFSRRSPSKSAFDCPSVRRPDSLRRDIRDIRLADHVWVSNRRRSRVYGLSGLSLRAIGRQLGISEGSVRRLASAAA